MGSGTGAPIDSPGGRTSPATLVPVAFDDLRVTGLLAALDDELVARYGNDGTVFPPHVVESYAPPLGTFVLAVGAGSPIGCGGLRPGPEPGDGEVKRMYVQPAQRGVGVARAVLTRLTATARELGYVRLVLETGLRQPEAISLYQRAGFVPVEPYGAFRHDPRSRCFALGLGFGFGFG